MVQKNEAVNNKRVKEAPGFFGNYNLSDSEQYGDAPPKGVREFLEKKYGDIRLPVVGCMPGCTHMHAHQFLYDFS